MTGNGLNGSKLLDRAENWWKLLKLGGNGWKQQEGLEMAGNYWTWLELAKNKKNG